MRAQCSAHAQLNIDHHRSSTTRLLRSRHYSCSIVRALAMDVHLWSHSRSVIVVVAARQGPFPTVRRCHKPIVNRTVWKRLVADRREDMPSHVVLLITVSFWQTACFVRVFPLNLTLNARSMTFNTLALIFLNGHETDSCNKSNKFPPGPTTRDRRNHYDCKRQR
jgi:hypothetical protein